MASGKQWGEIESILETNVKEINEELLGNLLNKLSLGGPMKLHQPYSAEDGSFAELPPECYKMEESIIKSIKLLDQIRNHNGPSTSSNLTCKENEGDSSRDMSRESEEAVQNEKMYKYKIKHNLFEFGYSSFAQGHRSAPPELRSHVARQILQKSVAALLAHAGYETAMLSALDTLTDVAHTFLQRLTKLLNIAVHQETESGPHGFPDAVEWAFFEAGLGSVTNLHHYYQSNILGYCKHLQKVVADLPPPTDSASLSAAEDHVRLKMEGDVEEECMEDDNVPELHFPALGNGETSEEMQSTLEPGFQMLHSLEEEALQG